jgi:uncharacterized protein YndB with AHSA1/START domain
LAPIISSTEVARPPEEVFAYVIDPSTMSEWQQGVVRGHLDTPTTTVGSRCTTVRKIGGREREVSTEITEYDPPRRWADRGVEGPIRAVVKVSLDLFLEVLDRGSRLSWTSRATGSESFLCRSSFEGKQRRKCRTT